MSSNDSDAGRRAGDGSPTKNFGHYVVLSELGRGGMATVYLALDSRLERKVALKVPHKAVLADAEYRERFLREARAAATLHHPNICTIYEASEIGGTPYMTMAFIEGKSLTDLVTEEHPIPVKRCANIVRKVALAMEVAHKQGIVHRDLKPSNIMLDGRKEPIVMDFGLARRNDNKEESGLTQDGLLIGTPIYMAPEVAKHGAATSGIVTDVYSLGTILYELLAGRPPYKGTVQHVLVQVMRGQPQPPSKYRDDIDAGIEAICLQAMAKKPSDRYQSMGEFAAALREYLQNPDAAAATVVEVVEPAETVKVEPEAARSPVEKRSASKSGTASRSSARGKRPAARRPKESDSVKLVVTLVSVCVLALVVIIGAIIAFKQSRGTSPSQTVTTTVPTPPPSPTPPPANDVNPPPADPAPPVKPVSPATPVIAKDGFVPLGQDRLRVPRNFRRDLTLQLKEISAPGGWFRFLQWQLKINGVTKDGGQSKDKWTKEDEKKPPETLNPTYTIPNRWLGQLKPGEEIDINFSAIVLYPKNGKPSRRRVKLEVFDPAAEEQAASED